MSVADDLRKMTSEQATAVAAEQRLQIAIANEKLKREVRRIVDAEEQPPRPPLRALTIDELFARPAADYLVDQLLPEGALAELVGDSESLKSFFAIHLGLGIASRQPNFFGQKVVKHGPVIYIAAEGEGAFQSRVRAWGQEHGVDLTGVPFHTVAAPVDLRDSSFQDDIQRIVATVRPLLIIVDTLHRCMPGAEENSSRDLGEVVAFATRLKSEYRTAVLFLHHPPKSAPTGRGRGSSALYYAADTELSAAIIGEENADGVKVVEIAVKKQKDDSKVRFTLTNRIVAVLDAMGRPLAFASGRPISSCVLEEAGDVETMRASHDEKLTTEIISFVRRNPACTKTAVAQAVHAQKQKVTNRIADLLRADRLTLDSKNRLYAAEPREPEVHEPEM